jgi:hypothetical protein
MRKIYLLLLFWSHVAFGASVTAKSYNLGSDKIGSVQLPGFWGNDGKTYIFQGDPSTFAYPVTIVGGSGSSVTQFIRNLTATSVTLDTTTSANNRPFPMMIVNGDAGAPVSNLQRLPIDNVTARKTIRFSINTSGPTSPVSVSTLNDVGLGVVAIDNSAGATGVGAPNVSLEARVTPLSGWNQISLWQPQVNSFSVQMFNGTQYFVDLTGYSDFRFNCISSCTSGPFIADVNYGQSISTAIPNAISGNLSLESTQQLIFSLIGSINAKLPPALGSQTVANSLAVNIANNVVPINASSLPLPAGASTSALQTTGNSSLGSIDTKITGVATTALQTTGNASLSSIDTKTPALGQQLAAASSPVVLTAAQIATLTPQTNALTDAQLRASAVPVSASSLPLPTGAATEATLSAINTKVPSNLTVSATRLLVDNSGVVQPVSASSLPLPTGAATETTLSALNTKVTAVNTGAVVVSSSVLPTGASTSALQTSGNGSLSSIDGKLPALVGGRVVVDLPNQASGSASSSNLYPVQFADNQATGSATAIGTILTQIVNGQQNATVQLTGTFVGTVVFETSLDGATWVAVPLFNVTTSVIANSASAVGVYATNFFNSGQFRIRCSAYTSGNIQVFSRASINSSLNNLNSPLPAGTNSIGSVVPTIGGVAIVGGVGASTAQTQRVVLATESDPTKGTAAVQLVSATQRPYLQNYATTPLSTTYTQIIASTPSAINGIEFFNGSSEPVFLATGAAASEVVQYIIPPGGSSQVIKLQIATAQRLSIRAAVNTINSGTFILNAFN